MSSKQFCGWLFEISCVLCVKHDAAWSDTTSLETSSELAFHCSNRVANVWAAVRGERPSACPGFSFRCRSAVRTLLTHLLTLTSTQPDNQVTHSEFRPERRTFGLIFEKHLNFSDSKRQIWFGSVWFWTQVLSWLCLDSSFQFASIWFVSEGPKHEDLSRDVGNANRPWRQQTPVHRVCVQVVQTGTRPGGVSC